MNSAEDLRDFFHVTKARYNHLITFSQNCAVMQVPPPPTVSAALLSISVTLAALHDIVHDPLPPTEHFARFASIKHEIDEQWQLAMTPYFMQEV